MVVVERRNPSDAPVGRSQYAIAVYDSKVGSNAITLRSKIYEVRGSN